MELFEAELPKDNSPIEDVRITTTLLYFSEEESKEFKRLCKQAMKQRWGDKAPAEANISDLLLNDLREKYGSKETIS